MKKIRKALTGGGWKGQGAILAAILLAASAIRSEGQTYSLSTGGASMQINVTGSSAGISSWLVGAESELDLQWYYYSVDGGTINSIDNLGLFSATETTSGNNVTLAAIYSNSVLEVQVDSTLKPGNNGQSILSTDFTLYNPDPAQQHNYSLYQYSDFDLGNGSANQSVKLTSSLGSYRATQTTSTGESLVSTFGAVSGGSADVEYVQAGLENGTQFGITNGAPGAITLNDTLTAGPGNVDFAYEANGTLGSGQTGLSLIETETVPEPSTMALIFAGTLAFGVYYGRKLVSFKKL